MTTKLPKFFKDASGFCYTATEHLAALQHLTPWDGDVVGGFAVSAPVPAPAVQEPVVPDPVEAPIPLPVKPPKNKKSPAPTPSE